MITKLTRRSVLSTIAAASMLAGTTATTVAADQMTFTLATAGSETDMRSVAMAKVFAPMVAGFADYQPGYNATLFAQGTELEAISRGNLTMSIASAQELAQFFPEFSIFATGYVHQDAAHQVRVFNDPLMDSFKKTVEDELGVKLLSVMYLGRRHVNLRQTRDEVDVQTPADLAGVNLRMPGTDAWQFLGAALGASPTPFAFTEVYTALSTGAVDGQDNPLPTVVDAKFYEVTKQIALTSHLVDLNYVAFSKATWDSLSPDQQMTVQRAALSTGAVDGQDNPLPTVVDAKFYEVTKQIALTSHLVDLNYVAFSKATWDSLSPDQQMTVQRAADAASAWGRLKQLDKENNLADFIRSQGVEIYTPDLDAFRTHVQAQYVGSEFAASWPDGVLEKINALGN